MTKPLLTIGLLVSNRKDTVEKCLSSLKPLLSELPSELIVVDTVGSEKTDGSLYIAKNFTDKVIHFDWCNDFAAARNVSLTNASGEWYMFLDDDEWFEDVSEIISFFNSGEYKKYNSATYIARNYTVPSGETFADASILRMVKRTPELRFEGRIHEHFSKVFKPCKRFSCYVHHYGYAYASEEEKKAHIERNLVLIQKEIDANPMDLRLHTQMAQELATFSNKSALEYVQATLQLFSSQVDNPCYQWLLALQFPLYEALGISSQAAEQSFLSLEAKGILKETAACAVNFGMMRICLINNDKQTAFGHGLKYMQAFSSLDDAKKADQDVADFARYISEETRNLVNEYMMMCK